MDEKLLEVAIATTKVPGALKNLNFESRRKKTCVYGADAFTFQNNNFNLKSIISTTTLGEMNWINLDVGRRIKILATIRHELKLYNFLYSRTGHIWLEIF